MADAGIRRFTRVNFNHNVELNFSGRIYDAQKICNLSLGGFCVRGQFDQQIGDICAVELREAAGKPLNFHAEGKVVWIGGNSMAVEFTAMDHDSFLCLQTALLYQADDPLLLGTEFGRDDVAYDLLDRQ
ncbi:PilZ domain-containing protein [Candidatus Electronema sp. JC]|uniref:PilZ domain-containing protein n=1 Tax=Candidatus Electronema sp. JC TaxID=3401570 RepID=UPI003B43368D